MAKALAVLSRRFLVETTALPPVLELTSASPQSPDKLKKGPQHPWFNHLSWRCFYGRQKYKRSIPPQTPTEPQEPQEPQESPQEPQEPPQEPQEPPKEPQQSPTKYSKIQDSPGTPGKKYEYYEVPDFDFGFGPRYHVAAALPIEEGGMRLWRSLTFFFAFPLIGICAANVVANHEEKSRPDFVPYEHLRIRNKKFPWGDGNHTLFHNKKYNALPEGYEEDQ